MTNFSTPQSIQIVQTVQGIVVSYLRTKLNDSGGPYQATLAAAVAVTASEELSGQLYKAGTPYVEVLLDRHISEFHFTTNGGAVATGHRHEIQFLLDMSMSDTADAQASPQIPAAKDRELCDAVCAIFDNGYVDLIAQGLEENVTIRAGSETQRGANRRNPHTLTVVAYTVDTDP